jgi:hypothetical protein
MSDWGSILAGETIKGRLEELIKVMLDISKELEVISLELGSIRHILEKEDK